MSPCLQGGTAEAGKAQEETLRFRAGDLVKGLSSRAQRAHSTVFLFVGCSLETGKPA